MVGPRIGGVVRSYKHMGTIQCIQGTGVQDARARAKITTAYYLPVASSFVGHQGIDVDTRTSVVQGLLSSRQAVGIVHSCRMRHLRRVLRQARFDNCDTTKDKEVLRMLHLKGTDACIRLTRLHSLPRICPPTCSSCSVGFAGCSHAETHDLWLADVRWLHNHLNSHGLVLDRMPDPFENPTPWLTLVQDNGWSSILALVVDRPLQRVPRAPAQAMRVTLSLT